MKIKIFLNDRIKKFLNQETVALIHLISSANIFLDEELLIIEGQNALHVEKTILSLEKKDQISHEELSAVYQMHLEEPYTKRFKGLSKMVTPKCKWQKRYINLLESKDIVFASGPAGTGKTHIAVAYGLNALLLGSVKRLILSRPAIEAGEKLGFLPGDLKDKLHPYLIPLYDEISNWIPYQQIDQYIADHRIEIAPLAYMRGRTLRNACIIVDEAQNTTVMQMKMLLTRLGVGSTMVITGDESQSDLSSNIRSGFKDAIERLEKVGEIGFIRLPITSIVRHNLISKILEQYEG